MILKLHNCLAADCPRDSHVWEYKRLTLQELLIVQETLGMEPGEFQQHLESGTTGLTSSGARAVIMLVNLMHRRDGIALAYADTDLDITELEVLPDPAPDGSADAATDAEADAAGPGEGKDDAPTPNHSPRHDAREAASGNGAEAESEPRSSTTPATSGAATASP